jgi:hypothetical protein
MGTEALMTVRVPGFVMPPFDRPAPKRFGWDDPDNPEHTPEMKAEVNEVAGRSGTDLPASTRCPSRLNDLVPRWLSKWSFRIRNRYQSLEDMVVFQQL